MKTFGINSLSSLFYYLTRIGLLGAILLLGFIIISFLIGFSSYWLGIDNSFITVEIEENFSLCITPIELCIKGAMGMPKIIPLLIFATSIFYVIILWYLNKMFKNFMSEKIFKRGVVEAITGLAYSILAAGILSFCVMYFSPHGDSDFLSKKFFVKEFLYKKKMI
jgi:hypothetical protein